MPEIAKNIFFVFSSDVISKIFGLLTTILIARTLPKGEYGLLSYVASIIYLLGLLTDLGYVPYGIKKFSQDKEKDKNLLTPGLMLSTFASLLILIFILIAISTTRMSTEQKLLMLFLGIGLSINSLSFSYNCSIRGGEKFKYYSASRIISSLAILALTIIYLHLPQNRLVNAGGKAPLIGMSLSFIYLFYINKKHGLVQIRLKIPLAEIRNFFNNSLPFALMSVFAIIYRRIDIIIIKKILGLEAVASYALAKGSTDYLNILPISISTVLFPYLSKSFTYEKTEFLNSLDIVKKIARILTAVAIPLIIIFLFWGEDIFALVFSAKYSDAGRLFRIIIWSILFSFMVHLTETPIVAGPKPYVNVYIQVLSMILYTIALVIILPKYGIRGAALSYLGIEALAFILRMEYVKRKIVRLKYRDFFLKPILAGALMTLVCLISKNIPYTLLGLVVYAAVLFFTGGLKK